MVHYTKPLRFSTWEVERYALSRAEVEAYFFFEEEKIIYFKIEAVLFQMIVKCLKLTVVGDHSHRKGGIGLASTGILKSNYLVLF